MQNIVKPVQGKGRPRKFKIPDYFSCLGHKITVLIVSQQQIQLLGADLGHTDGAGAYGLYDHDKKIIYLADDSSGSVLEETFIHELVHCLIEHAGYEELSADEAFVDMLAELFFQFTVTKKGYKNFEPRVKSDEDVDNG